MISQKITKWLTKQGKKHLLKVKIINLSKLNNWKFNKIKIYHQSKKFFQIVGIRVVSNFYKSNWDQPIIIQNEVGILGIIKNIKTKKYLLQAKVEPGNINKLQLEGLVKAGAFDDVEKNRKAFFDSIPNIILATKSVFDNKVKVSDSMKETIV